MRDEETLEKWKNSLTKEVHYTYLKSPEGQDPVVFKSAAEAERHFRENHAADVFASVKEVTVPAVPASTVTMPSVEPA